MVPYVVGVTRRSKHKTKDLYDVCIASVRWFNENTAEDAEIKL